MTIVLHEAQVLKDQLQGFPGGSGVKDPPAKAGDMGLSAGPGI